MHLRRTESVVKSDGQNSHRRHRVLARGEIARSAGRVARGQRQRKLRLGLVANRISVLTMPHRGSTRVLTVDAHRSRSSSPSRATRSASSNQPAVMTAQHFDGRSALCTSSLKSRSNSRHLCCVVTISYRGRVIDKCGVNLYDVGGLYAHESNRGGTVRNSGGGQSAR
jgi:hypothetical protein